MSVATLLASQGDPDAALSGFEDSGEGGHSFLRSIFETTPECIKVVAPDGALLQMNPAGLTMVGAGGFEQVAGASTFDLIAPEHREQWIENHRRVCDGERLTWEFDVIGLTGLRRHMETHAAPMRLPGGGFAQLAITRDVTARKRDERALREGERRMRAMLDALPAAVYTTDAEGRITYYNEAAVHFSGHRPVIGSDTWCVSWKLYWPDGTPLPHDECPMALALHRGTPSHGEYEAVAERPDGVRVPFIPYATPLFDAEGLLTGGINMLVDITERKKAEERQLLMINELNHRVKNTLAVVQSLAHLTLRNDTTPGALRDFEGRIHAMSAAHDILTSRSWTGAPVAELVHLALEPHCATPDRYTASGPDVGLSPQTAVALSMALHELCTNAVKHGALSVGTGSVEVAWDRVGDDRLILTWTERGGPPVAPPARRGFGVQMLERALAHELNGQVTIDFAPAGLKCTIAGPLRSV